MIAKTAADRAAWVHHVPDAGPGRWQETAATVADTVAALVEDRLGRRADAATAPGGPARSSRAAQVARPPPDPRRCPQPAQVPCARGVALADRGVRPTVVVAALSREKDLDDCAAELAPMGDRFVTTDFSVLAGDRVLRRSWSARQLAAAIGRHRPDAVTVVAGDAASAVRHALCWTDPDATVVVAGSFLLLDDFRPRGARHRPLTPPGSGSAPTRRDAPTPEVAARKHRRRVRRARGPGPLRACRHVAARPRDGHRRVADITTNLAFDAITSHDRRCGAGSCGGRDGGSRPR